MIVTTPAADAVTGHAADMYRGDVEDVGFVLGHTRALAIDPEAHAAFESLVQAIVPSLGVRLYELVTLAAASAIRSPHCLLAHGRKTLRAGIADERQLQRIVRDYRDADLTPAEVAAMAYAEKLSTDAAGMTDADSRALRAHGYTDRQIVDITLAAGARNLLSRTLLALAVPIDEVPDLSADVTDALLAPTRS